MIGWFAIVQIALAFAGGAFCVVWGLLGRRPNDATLGAAVLVELLLLAQVVVAIAAPLVGNVPTGDPLEFWIYLVSALLLPPLAVFWSLIERNRWSAVVVGVVLLAVGVMVYRMLEIWAAQPA